MPHAKPAPLRYSADAYGAGHLYALHEALWELYFNGRKPEIAMRSFELPPQSKTQGNRTLPGEIVAHDAVNFFEGVLETRRANKNPGR